MSQTIDLQLAMEQDTVARLPLRTPIEVQPSTIVRAAVALMRTNQLGCAVIVDVEKPVGIFTERSVLEVLMRDASLDNLPVRDFMDSGFRCVKHSEPISSVWSALQDDNLRFICVTDDEGKLVGLTGQRGLAEYVAEFFPQQVTVQRLGSKPWMEDREGA